MRDLETIVTFLFLVGFFSILLMMVAKAATIS